LSKFVRSNGPGSGRLPGVQAQRLYGDQIAVGEPIQLKGNTELERDIHSSLEIIAQERLMEVEAEAKSLLIRAKEEAGKLLEKANAQAKAMIDQAQGEVDSIRENAHEEGFKTGYAEGYTDATAQVSQETQELLVGAQTLAEGAYLAEKQVLKHFESRAVELIRHIVRQILRREMHDSPAIVMGMVERAVSSLYLSGKVQVVVSAQVIHDLRHFATETAQSLDGMSRFEFIADPALDRDQIYIVGQDACFDLSPDTQLEHMLTAIEPQFELPREVPTQPSLAATVETAPADEGLTASAIAELSALAAPVEALTSEAVSTPIDAVQDETLLAEASNLIDSPELTNVVNEQPLALSEPEVVTVEEPDPVAWKEFPADLQNLDGFPVADALGIETSTEALLAKNPPEQGFEEALGTIVEENLGFEDTLDNLLAAQAELSSEAELSEATSKELSDELPEAKPGEIALEKSELDELNSDETNGPHVPPFGEA